MSHPLFVLAAVGAAGYGLLTATQRRLPEGHRPFDVFPPGVDASKRLAVRVVTASSGRNYKVTSFVSADGALYYVAERKGDVDWLSYLQQPGSAERLLWGADGDAEDIEAMRRDFDVTAQPLLGAS